MYPTSLPARRSATERIRWRLFASLRDVVTFSLSGLLAFELRFDGILPTKYHHSIVVAFVCLGSGEDNYVCCWRGEPGILAIYIDL